MQSQWHLMMEVLLNTFSGFIISWLMTLLILNGYGYNVSSSRSAQITVMFTVASLVRSYVWRRVFNRHTSRENLDLTIQTNNA